MVNDPNLPIHNLASMILEKKPLLQELGVNSEHSAVDVDSDSSNSISRDSLPVPTNQDKVLPPPSVCRALPIPPEKPGLIRERFSVDEKDSGKQFTYYFYRSGDHVRHPFPEEYKKLCPERMVQVKRAYERFKKQDSRKQKKKESKKRARGDEDQEKGEKAKRRKQEKEEIDDDYCITLEKSLVESVKKTVEVETKNRLLRDQLGQVREVVESKKKVDTTKMKVKKLRKILGSGKE